MASDGFDDSDVEKHPDRHRVDSQDGNIIHDPSDGLTAVERAREFSKRSAKAVERSPENK